MAQVIESSTRPAHQDTVVVEDDGVRSSPIGTVIAVALLLLLLALVFGWF